MPPLIDNARLFGQRPEEFARLAEGHSPQVLFITCSDSRVVPALITGARPGELFEPRHVLTQLERLRAYPCIEKRLEAGELQMHGWYYEVHTGIVREHHAESGTFEMV
jgi:carbonic anhydrase